MKAKKAKKTVKQTQVRSKSAFLTQPSLSFGPVLDVRELPRIFECLDCHFS